MVKAKELERQKEEFLFTFVFVWLPLCNVFILRVFSVFIVSLSSLVYWSLESGCLDVIFTAVCGV